MICIVIGLTVYRVVVLYILYIFCTFLLLLFVFVPDYFNQSYLQVAYKCVCAL